MREISQLFSVLLIFTLTSSSSASLALSRMALLSSSVPGKIRQKQPLTLNQVEDLIRIPTPDSAIALEIERRGIAFDPDPPTLQRLRALGSGPKTIKALKSTVSKRRPVRLKQKESSRKNIILVANFTGLGGHNAAVTETIIDQLRDATKEYSDISVKALGDTITPHQGPEIARAKGKEHKAGIILWGWYSQTNESVMINAHFEILQRPSQLVLCHEKQTFILPLRELESFNIQLRLSREMTYLALLTLGVARLEAEDYDNAIKHFTTALDQSVVPENMISPDEIYCYRAYAYVCRSFLLSEDNWDDAMADLDQAIKLNTSQAKARLIRGSIYLQRNEIDKVITDCDHILGVEPKNPFGYFLRGLAYQRKGDKSRADGDYSMALKLLRDCCDDGVDYYLRALVAIMKDDFDRAIADIDQAIDLVNYEIKVNSFPRGILPVLFLTRGCAYAAKQNYDRAEVDFSRAVTLNPKLVWAYIARGGIYNEKKDYDKAIAQYTIAIELNPKLGEAYEARGDVYRQKLDWVNAAGDYEHAIRLTPGNAILYYHLGIAARRTGDLEKSIANLTKYITLVPNDEDGYDYRAFLYECTGDLEKSIADYNSVIALKPDDAYAYYYRGGIYGRQGKVEESVADFGECIKRKPDYAPAYFQRGVALAVRDRKQAIADLKMSIKLTDDPQIRRDAEQKLKELDSVQDK